MIDIVELENRLGEVEKSLSELEEERYKLNQQLKSAKDSNAIERFRNWGIDKDSCVVMFAKKPFEEFYIVCTFMITFDVDVETMYMKGIVGKYVGSAYGRNYHIYSDCLHFSALEEAEQKYNIYVIDKVQLALIQQYLCDLLVTEANINEYEEAFSKAADKRIS